MFFFSPDLHLHSSLTRVMLCKRRRTRTICLSLACIAIFLHLFLALLSLSIYHQPCDSPLMTKVHTSNHLPCALSKPAGASPGAAQEDASNKEGSNEGKGRVLTASASPGVHGRIGHNVDNGNRVEPWESGLEKLKALFEHPLYNLPRPPISEEDVLLKVKPKVKAVGESSQMWCVLCWWWTKKKERYIFVVHVRIFQVHLYKDNIYST